MISLKEGAKRIILPAASVGGGAILTFSAACGTSRDVPTNFPEAKHTPVVTRAAGETLLTAEQRIEFHKHLLELYRFVDFYGGPQTDVVKKRVQETMRMTSDKDFISNFSFTAPEDRNESGAVVRTTNTYVLRSKGDNTPIDDPAFNPLVKLTIPRIPGGYETSVLSFSASAPNDSIQELSKQTRITTIPDTVKQELDAYVEGYIKMDNVKPKQRDAWGQLSVTPGERIFFRDNTTVNNTHLTERITGNRVELSIEAGNIHYYYGWLIPKPAH